MAGFRISCAARQACWLVLCSLLVSVTTLEVYDELPPGDARDLAYQEDHNVEPGLQNPQMSLKQNWLLQQFIEFLRGEARTSGYGQLPTWYPEATRLPSLLETGLQKRLGLFNKGPKPVTPRQQKWKTKKGRAIGKFRGSQMVCYFKLCAFRSPV